MPTQTIPQPVIDEVLDALVEEYDASEENAKTAVEAWVADVQSGEVHLADDTEENCEFIYGNEKYWE